MEDPEQILCLVCGNEFTVEACVGGKCPRCGTSNFWQDGWYGLDDDELRARLALTRPIPVSERPPKHGDVVLVFEPMYSWRVGVYETDGPFPVFNCREFIIGAERATHWLPKPPDPE